MKSGAAAADHPPITEFPLYHRGKVRDVYDLGDRLLIVATDRLSAYDVVLPTPVPGKGAVLTQLSLFWFEKLGMPNHLITAEVSEYPEPLHKHRKALEGRSMLVRKARRFDVECVVRGYLAGSGWKDYQANGSVCGHKLPPGLPQSVRLETPLFTPAAKNDFGHDENIDFDTMIAMIGRDKAEALERLSLDLYAKARNYAETCGIILADTKFEFGEADGAIILIDEALTPDSSRFWPADKYQAGQDQPSYDKQYVRDWLSGQDWDQTPPGPELPDEIVRRTLEKYKEAYQLLTKKEFGE